MPETKIPVRPLFLTRCRIVIDEYNFAAAVNQIRFEPSRQTQQFIGLDPEAVITDTSAATWSLVLSYAQDWSNPDSLSNFLAEHDGEEVDIEVQPIAGSGPVITATVTLAAGAIGGNANQHATSQVTLGSTKPAITHPEPVEPEDEELEDE